MSRHPVPATTTAVLQPSVSTCQRNNPTNVQHNYWSERMAGVEHIQQNTSLTGFPLIIYWTGHLGSDIPTGIIRPVCCGWDSRNCMSHSVQASFRPAFIFLMSLLLVPLSFLCFFPLCKILDEQQIIKQPHSHTHTHTSVQWHD